MVYKPLENLLLSILRLAGLVHEFPEEILYPVVQMRLNEIIIPSDFKRQKSLQRVTTSPSITLSAQSN